LNFIDYLIIGVLIIYGVWGIYMLAVLIIASFTGFFNLKLGLLCFLGFPVVYKNNDIDIYDIHYGGHYYHLSFRGNKEAHVWLNFSAKQKTPTLEELKKFEKFIFRYFNELELIHYSGKLEEVRNSRDFYIREDGLMQYMYDNAIGR